MKGAVYDICKDWINAFSAGYISIGARVNGTKAVICVIGDSPFGTPMVICSRGNFHTSRFAIFESMPYPLLKLGKWHHLKLKADKNFFTLWVDGEKVLEFKFNNQIFDQAFAEGGACLGLTNPLPNSIISQ